MSLDVENDVELEDELEIELGFVCDTIVTMDTKALHAEPDWTKWDGGQIGGRPSWLCPSTVGIPSSVQLQCVECTVALSFLLQIYCPLDDVMDAFHRSLYIFVCRSPGCSRQGNGKAFRAQLPKDNAFYAAEMGMTKLKTSENMVDLCVLCGQRATFRCGACHVAQYCSKNHQKDHWTAGGHKQTCAQCLETHLLVESDEARQRMISKGSKWVFARHQLEIGHEPNSAEAVNEYEAKMILEYEKTKDQKKDDDADIDVTQQELNEALGHTKDQDELYVRFLTRIAIARDQVLRYCRWENKAVLWVHSEDTHNGNVPPCDRCGGERKFEFQVLPQLLNYLGVDRQSSLKDIASRTCEWGTLVVYTCAKSCPLDTQCAEEVFHYQPAFTGATS